MSSSSRERAAPSELQQVHRRSLEAACTLSEVSRSLVQRRVLRSVNFQWQHRAQRTNLRAHIQAMASIE